MRGLKYELSDGRLKRQIIGRFIRHLIGELHKMTRAQGFQVLLHAYVYIWLRNFAATWQLHTCVAAERA